MSKIDLRNELIKRRSDLLPAQRMDWSKRICQNILDLNHFQNAKHIGLYHNKAKEADIKGLLQITKKKFYLPILQANYNLQFYRYQLNMKLVLNQWNIYEPIPESQNEIPIDKLDIIFLPLLGFDKSGNRLGMGKGCYDRTIPSNHKSILIGVGFSCQECKSIPHQAHDIKLNYVITEENVLQFS